MNAIGRNETNLKKPVVIVICGPTASGKTGLSIELAKEINGEIVSCDSMQIYKDMNIGTAKPTIEEMQGIPHYLIDYILPTQRYSVANYKKDAKIAIKKIIKNGKTPILVGGTGLYIDSLIYEIEYPEIEFDEKFREHLENQVSIMLGKKMRIKFIDKTAENSNNANMDGIPDMPFNIID